ncbi:MAG: choloylglycine hydrolase family protein [Muribaculaceae bacterium]|nr:choloylglycine hydrolase family protein [Muribaculaceae bacterium]MCM1441038.1 choloylglycine hydrolase family protein [Roseburia sp.]
MQTKKIISALALGVSLLAANRADACTGITLKSQDGGTVVARTIDWSGAEMDNMYVIMPRAETQQSLLPGGEVGGMQFISKYGFVGLAVEIPQFVVDGMNEAGLSAALFYFPGFGEYPEYNPADKDTSIADFQLVSWILSNFSKIDEVKAAMQNIKVINIDSRASTVHWRITEASGRQAILEIVDGKPNFYESKIGVLANSPGYQWHLTNLNNYINLTSGTISPHKLGLGQMTLKSLSNGTGFRGLPGDMTSPSRFVRAAFFSQYSRPQKTTYDTVMQSFHLLNNFDVPIGAQYAIDDTPVNMPSATQWTISTDLKNHIIYYHTMYDRTIRRIDFKNIDFASVPFQAHPLDANNAQTIIDATISDVSNIPSMKDLEQIAQQVFRQ